MLFFSAKSFINRNKAVTDLLLQNQQLLQHYVVQEEQTSNAQGFLKPNI
jgi:hypothetical protein